MQGSDSNCCHWRVLQVEKHLKAEIRLQRARTQTKRGGFRLEAPSRSTRLGRIAQVLASPALSPTGTSGSAPPLSTAQHIMFPPLPGRVTHGAAPCTLMQCSNDASQCRCTRAVAHRGARCNPVHHHRDAPRCRCTQVVVHRGARCTTVQGGARDHQIVSQNPSLTGLDFRV